MKNLPYRNVLAAAAIAPAIVIPVSGVASADEVATPDVIIPSDIIGSEVETLPAYYSSDLGTFSDLSNLATAIINAARNLESTVSFTYTGDLSSIKTTFSNALNNEMSQPGNDYVHGTIASWKYSYTSDGKFTLTIGYQGTAEQEAYVTEQVQAIAASLNKAGMSDFDKVKAVNDYVVTHTVYSTTAKTTPHHVYAYLKEGKAVCQAYALLTYRLLTEMGVEARYVVGDAGGPHAWNSVKIDGQWYHLDTTWNDAKFNGFDTLSNIGYKYFLVTSDTLRKDHTWDEAAFPVATDNRYSQYHNIALGIELDGEIYYRHATDNTLYKLNIATGNNEQILTSRVAYLEAHNEYVYYSDFSNGGYLTSYNLITGEKEVLATSAVTQLHIVDGILNYKVGSTAKQYELPLTETEQAVRTVDLAIAKLSEFSPLADLEAARAAYTALTAEQQAKVVNLTKLTTLEQAYPANLAAANAVATNVGKYTETSSRANLQAVIAEFDALTPAQQALVSNKNQVLAFKAVISAQDASIAAVEKTITSLKATNKTLLADIDKARTAFDALSAELQALVKNSATLVKFETDTTLAQTAFDLIAALTGDSVDDIIAARQAYDAVPKAFKAQVTNLSTLTKFESSLKNVTAAILAIDAIDPTSTKFVAQVKTARKALNKAGTQADLVTNKDEFLIIEKQALVFEQISKLKASSAKYIAEVTAVQAAFEALGDDNTLVSNVATLNTAVETIKAAQDVVAEIAQLDGSSVTAVLDARASFSALPKAQQKYVTNIKTLDSYEKSLKAVIEAIKAIDAIDPASTKFVAQVKTARKALDKAKAKADLVTNKDEFISIEQQALVFEQISKLKPSSDKYIAEVTAAKTAYDALEDDTLVTNVATLNSAIEAIQPAQDVVAEIAQLDGSSVTAVLDARASLNALPKTAQKYVTNVKALATYEKTLKTVIEAIKAIEAIDTASTKFVAQVKTARKALDKAKVKADLVTNKEEFIVIEQQALVFEQISKLKPSSANYIAEVTAAKTAYDALTDSSLVTNVATLNSAIEAIQPALAVVATIASLDSTSVEAIIAARTALNALPKAQQNYVTNVKALATLEKKVLPISKAMKLIEEVKALNPATSAFLSKALTMKKSYVALSAANKALVTNKADYDYTVALYEIKNAQKMRKWTAVNLETFDTLAITGVTADNFSKVTAAFNKLKAGTGTATIAEIQQNVTKFIAQ